MHQQPGIGCVFTRTPLLPPPPFSGDNERISVWRHRHSKRQNLLDFRKIYIFPPLFNAFILSNVSIQPRQKHGRAPAHPFRSQNLFLGFIYSQQFWVRAEWKMLLTDYCWWQEMPPLGFFWWLFAARHCSDPVAQSRPLLGNRPALGVKKNPRFEGAEAEQDNEPFFMFHVITAAGLLMESGWRHKMSTYEQRKKVFAAVSAPVLRRVIMLVGEEEILPRMTRCKRAGGGIWPSGICWCRSWNLVVGHASYLATAFSLEVEIRWPYQVTPPPSVSDTASMRTTQTRRKLPQITFGFQFCAVPLPWQPRLTRHVLVFFGAFFFYKAKQASVASARSWWGNCCWCVQAITTSLSVLVLKVHLSSSPAHLTPLSLPGTVGAN